jgi:hypothetical protein
MQTARVAPRCSLQLCLYWLPAIAAAATAAATTTTTTTAAATFAAAAAAVVTTAATTTVAAAATTVATTTTAITATAVTTTTATAAVTTAAAAAAAALLALLGLVDAERATIEGAAVHTLYRLRGFLGRTHGHECKAARATRLAIGDEVHVRDSAEFLEGRADAFSIGVERKIANVQTSVHRGALSGPVKRYKPAPEGPRASKRVSNLSTH